MRQLGPQNTHLYPPSFFHVWLSMTVAAAQTLQPKLVKTSWSSTPSVSAAPDPSLTTVAPPGSALYVAKRGDSVQVVARHGISAQTSFLTSSELGDAIRKANGDFNGTFLKAGQPVIVPGLLPAPIVEKSIPVERDFEVRAIYLTGIMAASDHGIRIVKHWREVGGNAVVFDIKDSDGSVTIPFDHALLGSHRSAFHDLPKFIHFLHSQNMHAIARVAIFRDQRLVETHPELAIKSHKTGQAWRENGKLVWTDPSQPKVQAYDIALAKKAAEAGADEIQFDYVRFPAEGDQKDATFYYQTEHPDWHRSDVIADFLKHAYAELHPTGALLSLDVFGIMAWQRPVDLEPHRSGHRAHGQVLRRAFAHDLSLTLLRHGRNRPSRRRAGALHRRLHGTFREDHTGQWRSDSSVAAGFPLENQDLLAGIHQSPSGDREEQGRNRFPLLECGERLQQAVRSHAGDGRSQGQVFPRRCTARNCAGEPGADGK